MIEASGAAGRAAALRHDFDRAFAEPVHLDTTVREELLAIRVGGQGCAIRLSEVAGLHVGKKVTRVPGAAAALRGIAGFRGTLLPVYDLHMLLGHPVAQSPRWLVIAQAAPVALAFEAFERQLRVSREEILPQATPAGTPGHAREVVRTGDFVGPILHLPSVLDAIKKPVPGATPKEE